MGLFPKESVALKWSYLMEIGSAIAFIEYSNLYMKRLGFTSSQIGLSSLMGIQHLCLPLLGFLGDRFRARRLVLIVLIAVIFVLSLSNLLPLAVSFPTCFVNPSETAMNRTSDVSRESFPSANDSQRRSVLPSHVETNNRFRLNSAAVKIPTSVVEIKRTNNVPWFSALFVFMAAMKALFIFVERGILSLYNVATMTYLKDERASYGSYFMWSHIGAGISLLVVGLLASNVNLRVCGINGDGYHITFIWTAVGIMLSSLAIPWFKYEYLEHRVINWDEAKTVFSDLHYIIVLIVAFYIGSCTTFQLYWEFWYISELSGTPTIMGMAGVIRRPLVALWFYLSRFLIEKVGDLKSIATSLFLFSVSFLAISFINIPWLVLVIDLLQAAAYGISYTGLAVHFSKVGSKASSAVILGLLEMVYSIGVDAGSGFMGLLFYAVGAKATLFYYSIATAIILVGFLAYIYFRKDLGKYEKLPQEESDIKVDY